MEEERIRKDNVGNALKQALERRQTEQLPSNFSYRMMKQIRLEDEKQRKRKACMGWVGLLTSALLLIGLGVYTLVFHLDISFDGFLPRIDIRQDSSLFAFYGYIALLALVLVGLDYWLRKKYVWK